MSRTWLVAALALGCLRCGGGDEAPAAPYDPATVDADGDGVFALSDCDDTRRDRWQRLAGFADGDGDGRGAGTVVQVCSGLALPAGWVTDGSDCDDVHGDRWFLAEAYLDADGDGAPEAPLAQVCRGGALPAGWAEAPSDCAPGDRLAWTERAYLYRDVDGDGETVASAGVICAGAALPAGYSMDARGDDCDDANPAVYARRDAFVDADRDGVGGEPGVVCAGASLPAGWATGGGDCDDGNARAFTVTSASRDADGDGRGAEWDTVCGGGYGGWLPAGWSFDGTDCDDTDPFAWERLAYAYVDRDGDGHALQQYGSVCTRYSLPPGYAASLPWSWTLGECDDADATRWLALTGYPDVDGDTYGASPGESLCTAGSLPAGYASRGGDCDPADASRWQSLYAAYRDADGDGRFVSAAMYVCSGASLPAGYSNASPSQPLDCNDANPDLFLAVQGAPDGDGDGFGAGPLAPVCTGGTLPAGYVAKGKDCDDATSSLWRWVVLYPDGDGDGVGAPPRAIRCLGATIPAGFSELGWDANDRDPAVQLVSGDELSIATEL